MRLLMWIGTIFFPVCSFLVFRIDRSNFADNLAVAEVVSELSGGNYRLDLLRNVELRVVCSLLLSSLLFRNVGEN